MGRNGWGSPELLQVGGLERTWGQVVLMATCCCAGCGLGATVEGD